MPIDFSNAWKTGIKIINDAISLLPNLALAIVIFLVFLVRAMCQRRAGTRKNKKQKNTNYPFSPFQILVLFFFFFLVFLGPPAAATSLARRWVVRRKKHQGIA